MTHAALYQDWVTVQGAAAQVATQAGSDWLDISDYRDVVVYITTKSVSGAPTLKMQTSPSLDEELFSTIASQVLEANQEYTFVVRYETATTPPAKYLRWQLQGIVGQAFLATFRIHVGGTPQYGLASGATSVAAHAFLMEDWISIQAEPDVIVVQDSSKWLDLQHFQDVEFFVRTGRVTDSDEALLRLQTAPFPEHAMFRTMVEFSLESHSTFQATVRFATATVPLSRFVRWTLLYPDPLAAQFYIEALAFTRGAILPPERLATPLR